MLIITGSNMSGKSTFLRSVGLAAILARSGLPAPAASLQLRNPAVVTCMRVHDSLEIGSSQFHAEVTRLAQCVAWTRGQQETLVLLDEILAGTNSRERHLGTLAVLRSLASLRAAFPDAEKVGHDLAYPAMLTFLPSGLLGLVFASLAAAFMSTMSTQVNWGSSIVVNDLYHRFINPKASENQQVWAGRWATVVLMIVACTLALFLENALQVFNIVLQIGAGTGLLFILRWFWWRVNAESELTAMIVSFVVAVVFQIGGGFGLETWQQLLVGVGITTVSWISVAFIGPATNRQVLEDFVLKIRPGGPGWRGFEKTVDEIDADSAAFAGDIPRELVWCSSRTEWLQ